MTNIMDCTFNSAWDGETIVISTNAKIDLDTGRIFDVEKVDEEDVETLDREFIDFAGIDGEFAVDRSKNADHFAHDLTEILNALSTAAAARPF